MNRSINRVLILLTLFTAWACGPKDDPQPEGLPAYLRVPTTLTGYAGSGLITVDGGSISLRAEGPEILDATTNTYRGVLGDISGEDISVNFTVGQPRPYKERSSVPSAYRAYGNLSIRQTVQPGTYRMGIQESPGPRGEIADLTLNLPGPQLYITNSGSLTISGATIVKKEGGASLYRVRGTFQAVMYADGVGIPAIGRNPTLTGSFDVLLVWN